MHENKNYTITLIFFLCSNFMIMHLSFRYNIGVFFFPVNIKSAREPHFLENVHGHFFAFTGTLVDIFTGTFFWFTGRILVNVHGHFSPFTGTFSEKSTKNDKI